MPPLLNAINCPRCNTPAVFLWSDGRDALCERCYRAQARQLPSDPSHEIILAPRQTPDGTWFSGARIRFPELRQYIDECLGNDNPQYDERLLTKDAKSLEHLIGILETIVPPEVIPESSEDDRARVAAKIVEIQNRSVTRLKRNLENARHGDYIVRAVNHLGPVRRVQWRILAPHGHTKGDVVRYCEGRTRQRPNQFNAERLTAIYDFAKPDELYEGLDSFEGYLVFVYKNVNKAVMECGEVGNAIFVVNADRWQFLSHLSKMELLTWYSDEVRSYAHVGCWENASSNALRYAGLMRGDEMIPSVRNFRSLNKPAGQANPSR